MAVASSFAACALLDGTEGLPFRGRDAEHGLRGIGRDAGRADRQHGAPAAWKRWGAAARPGRSGVAAGDRSRAGEVIYLAKILLFTSTGYIKPGSLHEIERINRAALAAGMSYGRYVARMDLSKQKPKRRRAK